MPTTMIPAAATTAIDVRPVSFASSGLRGPRSVGVVCAGATGAVWATPLPMVPADGCVRTELGTVEPHFGWDAWTYSQQDRFGPPANHRGFVRLLLRLSTHTPARKRSRYLDVNVRPARDAERRCCEQRRAC